MIATVSFSISEFHSLSTKDVRFLAKDNAEDTFISIWKSFTKTLDKNWQSIEFEFNNETILVCKHWLKETNFNFQESHQIQ
jgi:hypothetical protein